MKMKPIAKKIHCKDGTTLSVQASSTHYCSPREDEGPYNAVEVGFIRKDGELLTLSEDWLEHADNGTLKSDVWGYVPVEKVNKLIADHGGINVMHI